jgi:cation transport regulator
MPYHTKAELPANVRALPEHAQAVWMAAFNNAYREYNGDEGRSHATAWAAANRAKKADQAPEGRAERR